MSQRAAVSGLLGLIIAMMPMNVPALRTPSLTQSVVLAVAEGADLPKQNGSMPATFCGKGNQPDAP